MTDPTPDLRAAMAAHGLTPDAILWTGKIQRFPGPNDRGRDKDGWYVAYPDPPAGAAFGYWPTGLKATWTHRNGEPDDYDPAAMARVWAEREAQRAEQRRVEQEAAALKAREMWDRATPATDAHPYVARKGIVPKGLRELDGKLLIPMRGLGAGAPLLSLQSIDAAGEKRFTYQAQVRGTRTTIGGGNISPTGTLYVVEGWATGWSVYIVTSAPVVVAFNAGNLKDIALAMRAKYPEARLVIAADNDRWTGEPGRKAAEDAARAAHALVVLPTFATGCQDAACPKTCGLQHPTDFNDAHQAEGVEATLRMLAAPYDPAPTPVPPREEIAPYTGVQETPEAPEAPEDAPEGLAPPPIQCDTDDYDLSHDGLALELGDIWEDDARHVAHWGRWMFYTGAYWQEDATLKHMTGCRSFLRAKAKALKEWAAKKAAELLTMSGDKEAAAAMQKWAKTQDRTLKSAQTVGQVIGLARSNPHQAATTGQWDADPWALGTPAGTVDLRTGLLHPARVEDYITKVCAVAPAPPGTDCPIWRTFLARVTDGDTRLEDYLQRFAGYSLTGCTDEHVFAFGYGVGANGKSTFVQTLASIMGAYATNIGTEMLMVTQGDRHPTELARLRGVRLAIGSETEEGKRWAEAKIKALTGGEPIAARFMREDFFEFQPSFKLFVFGNHRPSLRGVDEAMRRRLHFLPFTVVIPPEERDLDLKDKLRAEWPAILRWALDGCLQWQVTRLDPPATVRAASESYFAAEDAVSLWMEESIDPRGDGGAWESAGALFASWRAWAERVGEYVGSAKRFAQVLSERGHEQKREGGTGLRGYRGLKLKAEARAEEGRRYGS